MEAVKEQVATKKAFSFSIDVKKHKRLFDPLFSAINASTVLPILEDVLINNENGKISYSTTDLENIVTIELPSESLNKFTIVFPRIELKYLLRHSVSDLLDISLAGDISEPNIIVRSEAFTLKLNAHRANDYPKLVTIEKERSFTIDVKEIAPILVNALKFVSNDWLRPAMTGIFFTNMDGYLTVVSTDAHKLYWQTICKTPVGFENNEFLISAKAAGIIIMLCKGENEVRLDLTEHHLGARFDGKYIISRIMDEKYPNFRAILPQAFPLNFYINRKNLTSSLNLCLPFTNKSTYQINISVSPGQIVIDGGDKDFSLDFAHRIPLAGTNLDTFKPFSFGMNAKFLLTALSCSNQELVCINSSMSPTKAIIVDEHCLLMPLMLNQ
jgi:DNA polymerase-3 subunit beta